MNRGRFKMTDLKIDEEHISTVIKSAEQLIDVLYTMVGKLRNKDTDINERYLRYVRLVNLLKTFEFMSSLTDAIIKIGHDFNHEIFHTPSYKEKGWDKRDLNKNPFFINPNESSESLSLESFLDFLKNNIPDGKEHPNEDEPKEHMH
jgi:hypothetical protein